MKVREFYSILRGCANARGELQPAALAALPAATKVTLVHHMVRFRLPVLAVLLCPEIDLSWLNAMGYLYRTRGNRFVFLHTSEQQIAIEPAADRAGGPTTALGAA